MTWSWTSHLISKYELSTEPTKSSVSVDVSDKVLSPKVWHCTYSKAKSHPHSGLYVVPESPTTMTTQVPGVNPYPRDIVGLVAHEVVREDYADLWGLITNTVKTFLLPFPFLRSTGPSTPVSGHLRSRNRRCQSNMVPIWRDRSRKSNIYRGKKHWAFLTGNSDQDAYLIDGSPLSKYRKVTRNDSDVRSRTTCSGKT